MRLFICSDKLFIYELKFFLIYFRDCEISICVQKIIILFPSLIMQPKLKKKILHRFVRKGRKRNARENNQIVTGNLISE